MTPAIPGLHHVTAISGPAQACVDFHAGLLGLRLVKRTVNFDDPTTWHLYLGDAAGRPGTLLTFFPWEGVTPGRRGAGETSETAFAVPPGSLRFWERRLAAGIAGALTRTERFGEPVLGFSAPDGLSLALVEHAATASPAPWSDGTVPAEHAIRGLHGVTLTLTGAARTRALLGEAMGMREHGHEQGRTRWTAAGDGVGAHLDLVEDPQAPRAAFGAGSVHHIAWRVSDDAAQREWSERLEQAGMRVTAVQDRRYFHSVYFREPGGVLFELATDAPGFDVDETADALGAELRLPPWLEPARERIAAALPPLRAPGAVAR